MSVSASTSRDLVALGHRTAALTPGVGASLRTGVVAVVLLVPAVVAFSDQDRAWGITVLALALGGLGLLLAAVAVVELLPTPGRLLFHEHGFADVRRDHTTDLYLDGETIVHTVPTELLTPSAPAMSAAPTTAVIATR